MGRTLKMMVLGLAILAVCHAASINVTRNGDQGKIVNLRLLTSLTLGNVDSKKSGLDLETNLNLKTTGLDLETNLNLKKTGLVSAMGTNVDSKTTGLDKNCSLGTTGLDLGTTISCTHPFQKVGRKCYYFGEQSVTVTEAAKRCFDLGGILAAINSSAENTELYNAISKAIPNIKGAGSPWWVGGYWVGGFTLDDGKRWQWYTGQPINIGDKNWCKSTGQPDQGRSERCMHISVNLRGYSACWDTMACEIKHKFVCQRH